MAQLDLTALKKAVASLEGSLALVGNEDWFYEQSQIAQDTFIAGVIKNFEFVYELSVKMMKRRLELDSISSSEIDAMNFRDLLRTAAETGLISVVEHWFKYRDMRNITSHTYDHEKAQQVYEDTKFFINDAVSLLKTLEGRNGTTVN
jgi:nucleotidyltransferase substrate binding protein (TIGR01987 family)